ncbi:hypothetical protein [Salinibacterium sp. ZJ454]|uniref:hypothetical protein n=1 Tax=Salinibacterium sp. ZJ454 TaxID=2708339 RepID=UPI0014242078|nr:hypothetical protein [Salinibacterium sp. ZJ454]
MALPSRSGGSFIERIGRTFGTQPVIIIHRPGESTEERHNLEAQVQGSKAFFNVDAPVYDGDVMEIIDPRGGTRTVHITDVKINQAGGSMSSHMSHIAASFSSRPRQEQTKSQIIHGNAVIVSGNHVNVALDSAQIHQNAPITPGYEDLARALNEVLTLLESTRELDPDERAAAQDAAATVLNEIVKTSPDKSVVKRTLPLLRGVLQSAASAGAGAAATGLIGQLFV